MLVLHSTQPHSRRARPRWRRRVDGLTRALAAWLRAAWCQALATPTPDAPPPGPMAPAAALRDGAHLFDRAGEPIETRRVA